MRTFGSVFHVPASHLARQSASNPLYAYGTPQPRCKHRSEPTCSALLRLVRGSEQMTLSRLRSCVVNKVNLLVCRTSLHLAKGAAPDDGQRLEVGRAEPLPLQARVIPLSRLQLVQVFPPLGVRHPFPLQLALQLAAPV